MRGDRIIELLLGAVAAVICALALAASTAWPTAAVIVAGLVVGVLFVAVGRAIATARSGLSGRVAVGIAVGAVLGELAAVVVFSGAIDAELTKQASPGTATAAAALEQARQTRAGLDEAVARAGRHRDQALVVARCEVNPSANCPQIRITGVPGTGPEARTANDFLGDAQRELDAAIADRNDRVAGLEVELAAREQALAQARDGVLAGGLGARWQAMNTYTLDRPGSLVLRLLVVGIFVLATILPLLLKRWQGATTQEAESLADTAIAVKRAEVRAQVDGLWAEQELNSARLAVEAQNEIDAERQRRRVAEALEKPTALAALESGESASTELEPHRGAAVPIIPDVTKAAVRFIRPFVPPVVSGAIEGVTRMATKPLRQVFEETEEFHFTMRRTHRVTVESEGGEQPQQVTAEREWIDASGPRIESRRGVVLDGSDDYREIGESSTDGQEDHGQDEGAPRQLPPA